MSILHFVLGILGTVAAGLGLVAVSHVWVSVRCPGRRLSVRLVGSASVAVALYGVVFYGLVATGAFRPLALLGMLGACILGLWLAARRVSTGRSGFQILGEDVRRVVASMKWLYSGRRLWFSAPASLLVGANLLRSLVVPPLAWDSLTYHLVRAALWIRHPGLSDYNAPGAWQDYQALMPLGDALTAGVMVLPASDALVPLLWFGVWCFLGLSVFATARGLGADRAGSALGAGAAMLVPAVSGGMFVAYVDNLVGALSVAALGLFLSDDASDGASTGVLAMLALAAALATKKTALPFVGAGLVACTLEAIGRGQLGFRTVLQGVGSLVLVAGPPMGYLWAVHGSPLHPWPADPASLLARLQGLLGVGAESISAAGPSAGDAAQQPTWTWLKYLLFKGYGSSFPLSHLGYGPVGPLLACVGLAGFWHGLRRRSGIVKAQALAFIGAGLLAVTAVVRYPDLDPNLARYSVGAIGLIGAGAACLHSRWRRGLLAAAILGQLIYLAPVNWGPSGATATLYWLGLSVPFVVIAGLIVAWARQQDPLARRLAMVSAGLVVVIGATATLEPVRKLFRYDIYREASRGKAYANHPLVGADSYESTNLWTFLERRRDVKTAVTVGWDLGGLNWYVYPFFGSRLQNGITYVPVTDDGSLMPLSEKRQRTGEASYEAWRARLESRGVDFVAALAPRPVEVKAMEVHDDAFSLVARGPHPENRLYRVLSGGQ